MHARFFRSAIDLALVIRVNKRGRACVRSIVNDQICVIVFAHRDWFFCSLVP